VRGWLASFDRGAAAQVGATTVANRRE